jgi:hypothetical protein
MDNNEVILPSERWSEKNAPKGTLPTNTFALVQSNANKVEKNTTIVAASKTKITYDEKGLIIAGDNATTSDIAPVGDRNYVTATEKSKVANLPGDTTSSITLESQARTSSVQTLQSQIDALASGSPKDSYLTLVALEAAFPTGDTGIYVVTADGHWYFWNGSAWTDGGIFQSPLSIVNELGNSETDVPSQKLFTDSHLENMLISRGFAHDSFRSQNNYDIARCFQNLKFQSIYGVTKLIVYQGGWNESTSYCGFNFKDTERGIAPSVRFYDIIARPTGIIHHELIETLGTGIISFDFDWDYFNEKFPTDLFRPTAGDTENLYFYSEPIPEISFSDVTSVNNGSKIMAVGASFINQANGWFELACLKKGLIPINKGAGATYMYNNVAAKMLDANISQPHGSLFMVNGVDIFDEVDALFVMHATNQRIYPRDGYEPKTLEQYKATGVGTDNILAFDYVIKQYKQWCAEKVVEKPRSDGGVDVLGTKKCNIILCSHWLQSRKIYNFNAKLLANKHGISFLDFATSIGISENDNIHITTNYDGQLIPLEGDYNRSILYSAYTDAAVTAGKTEIIDGIMWGWHMQLKSNSFNYGNGQESDGYYYPNIQYIMSEIFKKHITIKND